MTRRDIVKQALAGQAVPYTPWSFRFTAEAREKLMAHHGTEDWDDVDAVLGNHIVELGSDIGFFEDVGNHHVRDVFGVVWDRRIDRDIGNVAGTVLPEPTLSGYTFPDPLDPRFFQDIPARLDRYPDRFRLYCLGFSLYERAWTLRGMTHLLIDFMENPAFVRDLFARIVEYNLAQVEEALKYDIDGVYFGDDWGQQRGLIMGYDLWRSLIAPAFETMVNRVKAAGKRVFLHSCGDVDELFDDLVRMGVDCFNPFQPEVMAIAPLFNDYHDRLGFWGGLSTQKTLPYGSVDDVRAESAALLAMGRSGGYIFSPAHAVEGDVPLENILAFVEESRSQTSGS